MRKIALLILIAQLLFSCNEKSNVKTNLPDKNGGIKDSLTNQINEIYKRDYINGFSVAIVNEHGTLYENGFGYADINDEKKYTEHTIQNIASISKIVVGLSLLKAQEMGLLKLDDPINKHLPFNVTNPNYPDIPITIRQLVAHTSSITDTDFYWSKCYVIMNDSLNGNTPEYFNPKEDWIPLESFLEKLLSKDGEWYSNKIFANRKPNQLNQYSNIGAALCGLVIQSASKTPFNEFTKTHIFTPLQMESTGWFFDEVNIDNFSLLYIDKTEIPHYIGLTYPDGHLITSSNNLAKLLTEIIKGYSGKGQLLKPNSYKEFFTSQLTKEQLEEGDEDNLGIFIEKLLSRGVFGHSGSDPGVFTLMFFDPNQKIGRILIKNTESENEEANKAFWDIWNTLEKYQNKLK